MRRGEWTIGDAAFRLSGFQELGGSAPRGRGRPLKGAVSLVQIMSKPACSEEPTWSVTTRHLPPGILMTRAGLDVLLTVDQKLRHQQNVAAAGVAVVVMISPSNHLADLVPLLLASSSAWLVHLDCKDDRIAEDAVAVLRLGKQGVR